MDQSGEQWGRAYNSRSAPRAGFWQATACAFCPVLAWLAKALADCVLVFVPVVGEQSLVGAGRGPVSGSFLYVAAEAFQLARQQLGKGERLVLLSSGGEGGASGG